LRKYLPLSILLACVLISASSAQTQNAFEVTFPAKAHTGVLTGRVFVILSRTEKASLLEDAGSWMKETPFFAADVHGLKPGQPAIIGAGAAGYPVASPKKIPAGTYYVQALINVYTEFHRSDGHVIWAHMDQWEGQQFNKSPGNLYSEVQKVDLDPRHPKVVRLIADSVIPPVQVPPDSEWVKHIKMQSKLLSQFWGQPIFIGAIVLLPKGYDQHPEPGSAFVRASGARQAR
jgi:hypothetical protein